MCEIRLRKVHAGDVALMHQLENDYRHWLVSGIQAPIPLTDFETFVTPELQDVFTQLQERLIIENGTETLGYIDLYDVDFNHRRAGVGILIAPMYRNNGYAKKAIALLKNYAADTLLLRMLYATIHTTNLPCIAAFEANAFCCAGTLKNWDMHTSGFVDVKMYQTFLCVNAQ
ncbi:MAG: GNAT family N-acetyltransferase [Bacteroidia bacterium]|nr:GNAT family N-acetyltransferase [Bacteroidia bacterium]